MSVPFIDLKSQYKALKNSIDSRIQKVLESGAYISGPEVAELEKLLAEHTGTKNCLAVGSGTDALLLPLMALGIGRDRLAMDEVITTGFSFIATAETICLAGAIPIYVDIDKKTFNMDPAKIEAAITPQTKAIMPVSLYGQTADLDEINAIAKKHNLFVIEDTAQSYGAGYKDKKSGACTTAAGTSFYPAKPLGCYGEGGAVFTNDDNLHLAMKETREHGSEKRYYHTRLGINARLDTIQCAILLAKMERYDWEVEARNRIASNYTENFIGLEKFDPEFSTPLIKPGNRSVWAQYTLTVTNRDIFQKKMQELGIPTTVHYPLSMPDQPWYQKNTPHRFEVPNARWAGSHVVSLPMFPDMDEATAAKIIEATKTSVQFSFENNK
ncbi:MAG: DegT/DnrJ/EryC1/StrS family aminotransferase [Moraxellaceae bacterium]|nr:DegT/DnrJ/EryC1/StrS family aminotransferase [Pseudobdellovibrionaceae bacterium]